ncbi:MAG: cell division protein FtsQ [Enterobacterales bacterium]
MQMIKRQSRDKKINKLKMATSRKPSATKLKKKAEGKDNKGALPIIFNAKVGYFLLGFLVIAGMVFSYLWIEKTYRSSDDLMPLRVVEIEGKLEKVTREEILEQILKGKVTGTKSIENNAEIVGFFSSDLELMEQRLKSLPWVQKVELRRVWPDKLNIKIKEQKAIARWNAKSLINEYGQLFTPVSLDGLKLPLLTGPEEELSQLLETFRDIQKRLESIDLQLAVLNLNHRYSWSLELVNGITLQVGREHLLDRVERFVSLYPLLQRESKLAISKIDLRYDTGLAVTRVETSEMQASL